jgi:hypothetical protein
VQRIVASRTYKDLDNPFRAAFGGAWHITIAQREVGYGNSSGVTSRGVANRIIGVLVVTDSKIQASRSQRE